MHAGFDDLMCSSLLYDAIHERKSANIFLQMLLPCSLLLAPKVTRKRHDSGQKGVGCFPFSMPG